jgi:hypothetical protein
LDCLPQDIVVVLALTALAGGTRLVTSENPRASRPRKPSATVIVCLSAAAVVLGPTLASRVGGPVAGGAVAAFPIMSGTLAVAAAALTWHYTNTPARTCRRQDNSAPDRSREAFPRKRQELRAF